MSTTNGIFFSLYNNSDIDICLYRPLRRYISWKFLESASSYLNFRFCESNEILSSIKNKKVGGRCDNYVHNRDLSPIELKSELEAILCDYVPALLPV